MNKTMAQATNYNYGLDAQLMSRPSQAQMAKELKQDQQLARRVQMVDEMEDAELVESDDYLKEELKETAYDMAFGMSVREAITHGIKTGLILRREINELRFEGFTFMMVLGLCAIKDFTDILSGGVFATLTTFFLVTVPLNMIFFMQGVGLKRFLIKNFVWKFLLITVLEVVPVGSAFPFYTISVFILKKNVDDKRRELIEQHKDVERRVKKLKSQRA